MPPNPNSERLIMIEQAVTEQYTLLDPFRFVDKVPLGAGQQIMRKKFVRMGTIPAATRDSVMGTMEKFASNPGQYRVPRHRITKKMDEDEYNAILAGGEYEGFAKAAAKELAASVAKTFFQNVLDVTATNDTPYWGLIDPGSGNGTFARPILCGPSTKVTGAWTTASIGANSAGALKARITKYPDFNDGTPPVAFYPNVIEEVMEAQNPGILVSSRIRDEFLSRFGAVVPSGEMDELGTTYAKSMLSGNEETPTDFDLVSMVPSWFVGIYETMPTFSIEEVGHKQGAILTGIHNIGLMPIPLQCIDGKIRKAAMILAASGT